MAKKEEMQTAAGAEPGTPEWYEARVPITLFKDNGKYRDDVFVAVNGESCQIQRGVEVKIKRKFALALENSRTQDMEAARIAAAFAGEYESAKGALE